MGGCGSKPDADSARYVGGGGGGGGGGKAKGSAASQDDATGGLSEWFEVRHLLGSGSAGDTWLCKDRSTHEVLAVKLMRRPIPPLMGTNIMREVKIGAALGRGHLNIVKPKEVILTRTHLGLVMEYVAGGNMADYILKTILLKFGSFDTRDGLVMEEDEARYFFRQIVSAVDYCHKNSVAHRDLKMDNTLLDDCDPPRIKLCDFGFAKWWSEAPMMGTITGTPDYMSPQLLGPKAANKAALYDGTKADIWAAGVLLCVMLIGRFPFEGTEMSNATNLEEVSAHVWQQQQSRRWHDNPLIAADCTMLSRECIDLLNAMFEVDEAKRITIAGIQSHPWFVKQLPPLYASALAQLDAEQGSIEREVKQGVHVCRDRDAALKQLIFLAASRYDPSQDAMYNQEGIAANGHASLRKISLTAIKPYQYDMGNVDMNHITTFFHDTSPDGLGSIEPSMHGASEAGDNLSPVASATSPTAAAAAAPPAGANGVTQAAGEAAARSAAADGAASGEISAAGGGGGGAGHRVSVDDGGGGGGAKAAAAAST